MVDGCDVGDMAKERAAAFELQRAASRFEKPALASFTHDNEARLGASGVQRRKSVQEQVEPLLRLEAADRANHHIRGRQSERFAHAAFARAITFALLVVDPIED